MTDDNKYNNGKIYTIRHKNDDSLIYVGSTIQPLYKRWFEHKSRSKNEEKQILPLYKKFNETDINDWYIELHEDCPCQRKEELNKREGEIIREIGTLNKNIAGRTEKEHYQDNREDILKKNRVKDKKYYENNKDEIQKRRKEKRILKHQEIIKTISI